MVCSEANLETSSFLFCAIGVLFLFFRAVGASIRIKTAQPI
jgi:hypothetical protein